MCRNQVVSGRPHAMPGPLLAGMLPEHPRERLPFSRVALAGAVHAESPRVLVGPDLDDRHPEPACHENLREHARRHPRVLPEQNHDEFRLADRLRCVSLPLLLGRCFLERVVYDLERGVGVVALPDEERLHLSIMPVVEAEEDPLLAPYGQAQVVDEPADEAPDQRSGPGGERAAEGRTCGDGARALPIEPRVVAAVPVSFRDLAAAPLAAGCRRLALIHRPLGGSRDNAQEAGVIHVASAPVQNFPRRSTLSGEEQPDARQPVRQPRA